MRGSRMTVTNALILINIAVFLLEEMAGGSMKSSVAIRFGAQLTSAVTVQHQWWRLFTAMFVHFGAMHILSNMISLYLLGRSAEQVLGPGRMLTLYLVSGIVGTLCTVLLDLHAGKDTLSAGASGAIFGLMGLYVAMALLPRFRPMVSVRNILIMLALNAAYGIQNRSVNMTAHTGGLAAGTVLSLFFLSAIGG